MKKDAFGITRSFHHCGLFLALSVGATLAQPVTRESADGSGNYWLETMQQVHARFTEQPGTLAQFGDSIPVTMAFGAPLPRARKNASGLLADYTRDCQIVHNPVHDPENRLRRLIRLVHDNDGLLVANNLLSGPPMRVETESQVRLHGNITKDLTAAFVNAREGNLQLKESVSGHVKAAEKLPAVSVDIDNQPRSDLADVGADQFTPVPGGDQANVGGAAASPKNPVKESKPTRQRGFASAEVTRPAHFPHRIWAACDFERRTPDYAWFGPAETNNIPRYPGNTTALGVGARPYEKFSALMTGINPVPGPRMGKVNHLYLRYFLTGGTEATFQHFSLSTEDNNHIRMSGLNENKWAEVAMNFSRDGLRNDGTPGVPFKDGERMDDLKIFVGKPDDGKRYELFIDDVIFFAEDPSLPPEPEPFPNRVIFLAAFDTGPKEKYWPGTFEIVEKDLSADSYWRVARAVPRENKREKLISLQIEPVLPVGAHTKLRFRYHLTGSSKMTVQIFDATDQDNRHLHLTGLKEGAWHTLYLDFTRDAKRNDGSNTLFAAGHLVDDIFFFVAPDGNRDVNLLIDEVVLFDAATR